METEQDVEAEGEGALRAVDRSIVVRGVKAAWPDTEERGPLYDDSLPPRRRSGE